MTGFEFSARPGLTAEVNGDTETFKDEQTGFEVAGQADPGSIYPPAYSLRVTQAGSPPPYEQDAVTRTLQAFERSFLPASAPAFTGGLRPLNYSKDQKRRTMSTGGARRNYCSVPLAMCLLHPEQWRQWFWAEYLWNVDQLNRPLCHVPFNVSGDQWSKKWVNAGTDRAMKHDDTNAAGWTAFDTAHADYARIAGLAAMGHPLGIINAHLVWRWLKRSAGGTTNWLTQPRGAGWVLGWGTLAHFLGLKDDHDQDGPKAPREYLTAWADQLTGQVFADEIAKSQTKPDGRNAPLFTADWNGHGPQLAYNLVFHFALMSWGILRVVRSGILDGPANADRKAALWELAEDRLDEALRIGGGPGGTMSYTIGWTHLDTRAEAEQLAFDSMLADPQGYRYEAVGDVRAGSWRVRRPPQASTAELFPALLESILGPSADWWVDGYTGSSSYGKHPEYDLLIGGGMG